MRQDERVRSPVRLLPSVLVVGCAAAPMPAPRPPVVTPPAPVVLPVLPAAPRAVAAPAPTPAQPFDWRAGYRCPEGMALTERAQGPYCIDRWEGTLVRVAPGGQETDWPNNRSVDGHEAELRAVSRPGRRPQGYISGLQAQRVCANAGKALCEVDQWVQACRGPEGWLYPYGQQRRAGVCNDRFKVLDRHPVPILWRRDGGEPGDVLMWHPKFMNDPRLVTLEHTLTPGGALAGCMAEPGVYDQVGNLHEWVRDADGTFMGGFFMDTYQNGEGCDYRTLGHGAEYHDYSTGFRCCADAEAVEAS